MTRNLRRVTCPRCGRMVGTYIPTIGGLAGGTEVFRSHSPSGARTDRAVCPGSTTTPPAGSPL